MRISYLSISCLERATKSHRFNFYGFVVDSSDGFALWHQTVITCHVTVELLLRSLGQSCFPFLNLCLLFALFFLPCLSVLGLSSLISLPQGGHRIIFSSLLRTTTNFDQCIAQASAAQDNKHASQCLFAFPITNQTLALRHTAFTGLHFTDDSLTVLVCSSLSDSATPGGTSAVSKVHRKIVDQRN